MRPLDLECLIVRGPARKAVEGIAYLDVPDLGEAGETVAVTTTAGRTNGGALGSAVCSTSTTAKPAARTDSSVGRLQSQHTTSRFSQFSRSCRRAVAGSSDL